MPYKEAVIPDEKIAGYSLNMNHKSGRDKAIAFQKYLGYNIGNQEQLIAEIRKGIKENIATERKTTEHGRPFEVVINMKGANGKYAKVKSGWIIDEGKDIPRLVSVYVKE